MKRWLASAALALNIVIPAHADTLIDNVKGLTATPFGQVIQFSALLIGDDGKIVRTYAEGDKIDVRARYRVDGKGRVLLPGLVQTTDKLIDDGLTVLAKRNNLTGPLPKSGPRDRDLALDVEQNELLSQGYTTVAEIGTSAADWLALRRAGDEGRLRLRVLAYADGVVPMTEVGGGHVTPWLYNDHLRMAGVEIDGHIPVSKSVIVIKNDETRLRNQMSLAAFDGFQIIVSTTSTAEVARADAAVNELKLTYPNEWLWRFTSEFGHGWTLYAPGSDELARDSLVKTAHDLAHKVGADDRLGDLAPGKMADFSIWDASVLPLTTGATASETWVGGVKVYERKP
jgi:hypothetical protein